MLLSYKYLIVSVVLIESTKTRSVRVELQHKLNKESRKRIFTMMDKGKKRYGYKGKKSGTEPAANMFKGAQEEIKDHTFVHDLIKTKKWITSKEKFIEFAGTKYGANESATLEQGIKAIVTSTFVMVSDADYELKSNLEKMLFRDDYKSHKIVIAKLRENLPKLYGVLWGQCDSAMQATMAHQPRARESIYRSKSLIWLEISERRL